VSGVTAALELVSIHCKWLQHSWILCILVAVGDEI